jgi:hypothetical protein
VIANETCASRRVVEEVRYRAGPGDAEVLVVAPALASSRLSHWLDSDSERRREDAERRLETSVSALADAGLAARGEVGDGDPLQALDDALRTMEPDEVIISTHTPERSTWLERKIVQQARARYALPITHVVVDIEREGGAQDVTPRGAAQPSAAAEQESETLRLYHAAPYEQALAIRASGFSDSHPAGQEHSGVWLTDQLPPLAGEPGAPIVFAVDVPRQVASGYEAGERDGARLYLLPADALNRLGPAVEAADDWVE